MAANYKRVNGDYVITTLGASDNVIINTNTLVVNADTTLANVTLEDVTIDDITATGNISVGGTATVAGNIATSGFLFGDATFLSNVIATTTSVSIVQFSPFATSNVVTTGNASNVDINVAGFPAASFIPGYIQGDLKGSVYAEDSGIIVDAVNSTINAAEATIFGNVTASYFYGNGSQLTGIDAQAIQTGTTSVDTQSGNVLVTVNGSLSTTFKPGLVEITSPATVNGLTSSGNVTVDANLAVNGNVTITGNLTYIDVENVKLSDPLLFIASNNVTNVNDVGFVANINPGVQQQTGFARDATDGVWKLFSGITSPITTTIDFTGATYDAMRVGSVTSASLTATGNITGGNLLTSGVTINSTGVTATTLNATGNVSGGNITTVGQVVATGNVAGGNLTTTGVTVNSTGITATGNIQAGNLLTTGATISSSGIDTTGNIVAGNISVVNALTLNTNAGATAIINGAGNTVGNIGSETGYFGTVFATAQQALYADLAEVYIADAFYPPGTVLVFGGDREVTICNEDSTHRVAGVVSTAPAYLMNSGVEGENLAKVALVGRVPCQVVGPVQAGDLLVGAVNGCARVDNNAGPGRIIGKSLETSDNGGLIEIVVGKH